MTEWTRPSGIRRRVEREWASGRLLAGRVTGTSPCPIRIPLRRPTSSDLAERFDEIREWIRGLESGRGYRLEFREINHRVLGRQRLPVAAWVDTDAEAFALLGKTREARAFDTLVASTPTSLREWLAEHPLVALEVREEWPRLLAAVEWIRTHPNPGLYLRQVDAPGVHTKLIERHRRILAGLLDQVTTPMRDVASGTGWFERRYGFRTKSAMVRFRMLDEGLDLLPGVADLAMPKESFAALDPVGVRRVFITENEVNFLSFPPVCEAMVVFGGGNEVPELLAGVPWLDRLTVCYWGDIDTHGFWILDRLRGVVPSVRSLLMDREVLDAHRGSCVLEPKQVTRDLERLTPDEFALYDDLRGNRLGDRLRLEQERIGFDVVRTAVAVA